MTVLFFSGGAGTGKTTRLMEELRSRISGGHIKEGQKILALTFMHGSRRRLEEKLRSIPEAKGRFSCQTIDSFAYGIVSRWKDLAVSKGYPTPGDELEYEKVCQASSDILNNDSASIWVSTLYPIIVLDEFQDCNINRISIFDGLSKFCTILAALDPFQDLSAQSECHALKWLKEKGTEITLTQIHRTSQVGLISAFTSVRNGTCPSLGGSNGIFISYGHSNSVSLSSTARTLTWKGAQNTAILCPTSYGNCPFFRHIIDGLSTGKVKFRIPKRTPPAFSLVGPFRISYEKGNVEIEDELWLSLGIKSKDLSKLIKSNKIKINKEIFGAEHLETWLSKQRELRARIEFSIEELKIQIKKIIQRLRAFSFQPRGGIKAITVHQAKNREFDHVILLWPLKIDPDKEKQKRLFYNGITRARVSCSVIIQGNPESKRLESVFE